MRKVDAFGPCQSGVNVCIAGSVVQLTFDSPIVAADCHICLDFNVWIQMSGPSRNGLKLNDGLSF